MVNDCKESAKPESKNIRKPFENKMKNLLHANFSSIIFIYIKLKRATEFYHMLLCYFYVVIRYCITFVLYECVNQLYYSDIYFSLNCLRMFQILIAMATVAKLNYFDVFTQFYLIWIKRIFHIPNIFYIVSNLYIL